MALNVKKLNLMEIQELYDFLMETSEIASGAILRFNPSITEKRRLEMINVGAEEIVKKLFYKYNDL